jgi:hypothetical protein
MYPDFTPLDQLEYRQSIIYLQDRTYEDFLRNEFDPTFDHILQYGDTQEYFTITRE